MSFLIILCHITKSKSAALVAEQFFVVEHSQDKCQQQLIKSEDRISFMIIVSGAQPQYTAFGGVLFPIISTAGALRISVVRYPSNHLLTAFDHLSLYKQKHFGKSVALCGILWKGRSWQIFGKYFAKMQVGSGLPNE